MIANIHKIVHTTYPRWLSNGVVDHKAWEKRILERQRLGDKTLFPLQIRFAHEAMAA